MDDWPVVALRFGIALTLSIAFGSAFHALLTRRRRPETQDRRWSTILPIVVGLILSALGLVSLVAAMAGTDVFPVDRATLAMVVADTPLGWSFLVRFAALGVAIAAVLLPGATGIPRQATIAGATGIALATLAWTGHGAMDEGVRGWVHLVADVVHLLLAGAWIGVIAALLALVVRSGRDRSHLHDARTALASFATIGSVLVGSIVVTGAVNGWTILGREGLGRLFATDYGVLLIAKIALFATMLAIAAANRWVLAPMLARSVDDGGAALAWLRTSLIAELVCAVAIVALVGWLGTLSPQG